MIGFAVAVLTVAAGLWAATILTDWRGLKWSATSLADWHELEPAQPGKVPSPEADLPAQQPFETLRGQGIGPATLANRESASGPDEIKDAASLPVGHEPETALDGRARASATPPPAVIAESDVTHAIERASATEATSGTMASLKTRLANLYLAEFNPKPLAEPAPVESKPPESLPVVPAPPKDLLALLAAPDGVAGAAREKANDEDMTAPTPEMDSRIVIHFGSDQGLEAARRVGEALLGLSDEAPEFRRVPFPISDTNTRYFFASDQSDAELMDHLVHATLTGGAAAPGPLDFTDYQPSPPEGTIEIWLAD